MATRQVGSSGWRAVCGKTGSGKSTLLHALITSLCLVYGPGEAELYLIDFKKGVEFKPYASRGLPHARVIAIESEREFGLSVLQRLDADRKARGDRFRERGVQDLARYRDADPGVRLPRIVLVVDEFQEFFVEDDRVARESTLPLDRLVRQGRAFGIHVVLGSQTLGGAYTLARSTIDQMAVRIALQCSEADGRMILGEENPAARLLSRPGEAIYNDANGLVEGNTLFQVVWLPDEERDRRLDVIRHLAEDGRFVPPHPQIVFEGNAPAVPGNNHLLAGTLAGTVPPPPPRVWRAWLGEPVAIKDPTCATFRPQSASNLLIVGQQEETTLGMVFTAVVGLASQKRSTGGAGDATFYVFDGTPADSPHVGVLGRLKTLTRCPVHLVGRRHVASTTAGILAEVNRRLQSEDTVRPTFFVVVHGLQYFRDLRRQDDPFSRRVEEPPPPNPAEDLLTIAREGPPVGVHTILWCDTVTNLNRTLDRQGLREFEMRAVLQMSATDSSALIDTPAASKLGFFRAYFYHEEWAAPEKFRPYGLPAEALVQER